jgi:hypothetical protein
MTKYYLILLVTISFSCRQNYNSILEINFTSKNNDTIQEMKSFQLTSLTELNKTISFTNPKSTLPNKFIFEHLKNGLYIGLMRLEKNGSSYNIAIDSIVIKDGSNVISKELNLGTVKLPG